MTEDDGSFRSGELVVVDASVMPYFSLLGVLVRCHLVGVVGLRWTGEIVREAERVRPSGGLRRIPRRTLHGLLHQAGWGTEVTDHTRYVNQLHLPDKDDRHVAAAAVAAGARLIVTRDLGDFPEEQLRPHGLLALHPDELLQRMMDVEPVAVVAQCSAPGQSLFEVVEKLEGVVPGFAERLAEAI